VLLHLACDRIGLRSRVLKPEQCGILTDGEGVACRPLRLSSDIRDWFLGDDVLILPGFVGVGPNGKRALLGRGGSDFSAIFVAGETPGARVRLCKDVDGVYNHDPADGGGALRFDALSWDECLSVARPLLQPVSVAYARERHLEIEVGAIGTIRPTFVGSATCPPSPARPRRPLRIGLAGFGTVGQALYERLREERDFIVETILVRDADRPRRVPPQTPLTDARSAFAARDFDILVDMTSDARASASLCLGQLARGRYVVTANKSCVAEHLESFETACAASGAAFL
jgi:homoserine dehydrogenase